MAKVEATINLRLPIQIHTRLGEEKQEFAQRCWNLAIQQYDVGHLTDVNFSLEVKEDEKETRQEIEEKPVDESSGELPEA